MGVSRRGKAGVFQHFRRVPKRYGGFEPRQLIRTSLHTTDPLVAQSKAAEIETRQNLGWEAALVGKDGESEQAFQKLTEIAQLRGISYLPASDVATLPLMQLLERVEIAQASKSGSEVCAALGAVDVPGLPLKNLFDRYRELVADRLVGKTPDQIKRWQDPRKKVIKNLTRVLGNVDAKSLSKDQALKFRQWWWKRVKAGDVSANTANKDMTYISAMIGTVAQMTGEDWPNPFRGLRFKEAEGKRAAFSSEWIRSKLLHPEALASLNPEAAAVFLTMINTGARPSELIGLRPEHIHLDHKIPHISICAEGRSLKTRHSERKLPLCGVSLKAMRGFAEGFPRYAHRPSNWSATVTKYLRQNELLESPGHTAYSLRHSLSDRLQNAGCEDRTRKEIMGHRPETIIYGSGSTLELRHTWLQKVAFC